MFFDMHMAVEWHMHWISFHEEDNFEVILSPCVQNLKYISTKIYLIYHHDKVITVKEFKYY